MIYENDKSFNQKMACILTLYQQIPKLNTMKKIYNLALVISVILFSCERTPEAYFSVDNIEPEVGQEVFFNNESLNADSFEWDFGDGFISNDPNPVHIYTATGTYEVVLTAVSANGQSDQASITINVMIPTLLEIEVLEYYDEYTLANARVRLFPTLPDWEAKTNIDAEGYTDKDGVVVFSHLGPYVYYVDVWETHHDNYTLKNEPDGVSLYIRTNEIVPHKINRFTAWVDYYENHGKGSAAGKGEILIKKTERRADDNPQSYADPSTEGWQKLYDSSVKLK
jgi:PKD repeat protein